MKMPPLLLLVSFFLASCSAPEGGGGTNTLSSLVDTVKKWMGLASEAKESETSSQAKNSLEHNAKGMPPQKEIPASFEDKMKQYKIFEQEELQKEESLISKTEDESNQKMEELLQDKRVTAITDAQPDVNLKELPQDVYKKALALMDEEEKKITEIMDETDKKLEEKSKEMGLWDRFNKEELLGEEAPLKNRKIEKAKKAKGKSSSKKQEETMG